MLQRFASRLSLSSPLVRRSSRPFCGRRRNQRFALRRRQCWDAACGVAVNAVHDRGDGACRVSVATTLIGGRSMHTATERKCLPGDGACPVSTDEDTIRPICRPSFPTATTIRLIRPIRRRKQSRPPTKRKPSADEQLAVKQALTLAQGI